MGANNSKNTPTEAKKNVPVENEKKVEDAVKEEEAGHENAAHAVSQYTSACTEVGKSSQGAAENKRTTKDFADVPSAAKNKRDSTPTKNNVIYSCKATASLRRSSELNEFDKNVKVKLERSAKSPTKFVWNPFSRLHHLLEKSRPVICSLSEVKREPVSNLLIEECVAVQCNPTVKIKKEKLEAVHQITAKDNKKTFSTEDKRPPSVEDSEVFFEALSSENESPTIKTEIFYSKDESEIYFDYLATKNEALPLKAERQSSEEQNGVTSSEIQEPYSENESEIAFEISPLKNATISTEIVDVEVQNGNFEALTTRKAYYKEAHASRKGKNKETHASRKGIKASVEIRVCKNKRKRQVILDKFFNPKHSTQNKTTGRRKRRKVDKAYSSKYPLNSYLKQTEIITRSKNSQLSIRPTNTHQRAYSSREMIPKPLKLELQECDAPNLRVPAIATTLPKPILVKCEAGVQRIEQHMKIEPNNLSLRLQPKVLLKRLHMPILSAFKGRDLIAAAEETNSKLVNPPVLEIKLEILKEQEFIETTNKTSSYRHNIIVKQEQDEMPPMPPCKKRKLNSCLSLSQLPHMPKELNPIVRIKRLKLEIVEEQAFSDATNLKPKYSHIKKVQQELNSMLPPSGKKRNSGSCLSISTQLPHIASELQIRNAYSLNPCVRIKRLKLESNVDLSIHTEHSACYANENTMPIASIKLEPVDNVATTTNFDIDSVASGYNAHMLMSPALKQEPPWEYDDSGISMDLEQKCCFDFFAEESEHVQSSSAEHAQNDELDETLIRRIAMERARTKGLLLFYGSSPMQYKLFNTVEDLRVFLDYLLVK